MRTATSRQTTRCIWAQTQLCAHVASHVLTPQLQGLVASATLSWMAAWRIDFPCVLGGREAGVASQVLWEVLRFLPAQTTAPEVVTMSLSSSCVYLVRQQMRSSVNESLVSTYHVQALAHWGSSL